MTRTAEILNPLTSLTDDLGVLTVYLDASPTRIAAQRPEWEVVLRASLGALRERVKAEEPHERWTAVHAALDALDAPLADLVDPQTHGRGRVLVAALARGEVHTLRLQVPLPDDVVLADRAHVLPLVAALDEAPPVGILTVARDGVRAIDLAFGEAREVDEFEFREDTSEWRRKRGTSGHNPALGAPGTGGTSGGGPATGPMYQQSGTDQRDRYDRKLEDHQIRFLAHLGPRLAEMAAEQGWEHLVLVGDPRLTQPLAGGLPSGTRVGVLAVEMGGEWRRPQDLADEVMPLVTAARREEEARLVAEARGHAAAGGPGRTELEGICDALFQGRVDTLLMSAGRSWEGMRAPDGRLAPVGTVPDGVDPGRLEPVPDLARRMLEMALDTSARAVVVEDAAAEALDEVGGAAAILRW